MVGVLSSGMCCSDVVVLLSSVWLVSMLIM